MSDEKRTSTCRETVEKILDDMTAEMRNNDGQYMPLGFPSQQNVAETVGWGQPSPYLSYGLPYAEPHLQPEPLANYLERQSAGAMFEPVAYPKNPNLPDYNSYTIRSNSAPQSLYNNYPPTVMQEGLLHEPVNSSQMFDKVVPNNWALNDRQYSPFGDTDTFKPSSYPLVFQSNNGEILVDQEPKYKQPEFANDKFNFNKEFRKDRPLAEVKPMRPSYSDVLTKPVPATNNAKPIKIEANPKIKKESRKNGTKSMKAINLLNRSNTNNDIKDLPIIMDKTLYSVKPEKKSPQLNQLNRKWNSLDNISEGTKSDDLKRTKKSDDAFINKASSATKVKGKLNKSPNVSDDPADEDVQAERINITKNVNLKKTKNSGRSKANDTHGSGSDKNSAKRSQRSRKRDCRSVIDILGEKAKLYSKEWWKVFTVFALWFIHLISDICSLSIHLGKDFILTSSAHLVSTWKSFTSTTETILKRFRLTAWLWEKFEKKFKKNNKKSKYEEDTNNLLQNGLENNITMPTTGDEAMKRLLACKGKDPYSILGVTPKCSDDDIKKYYKRQAVLVHPDKNNQPGAEEAFKILVHAFDMIGTPEHRTIYDRGVAESAFVVQNFSQMAELLRQLQQKMEMNANTIRCSACGDRHKRIKEDRPSYAARNCKTCKIHHAAREGDIWAEAKCFGFLWHYYACMEGSVYDITDWAGCQKETLKHLKPDSHHVQYRIALGKQNNNQPRRNSQTPRMDKPDLENLLNSLYGQNDNGATKRKSKNNKK